MNFWCVLCVLRQNRGTRVVSSCCYAPSCKCFMKCTCLVALKGQILLRFYPGQDRAWQAEQNLIQDVELCEKGWEQQGDRRDLVKGRCSLLSWLHTEGLPQLWLCPQNSRRRPQAFLAETFASGLERSAKLWCGPTELFSPERARFQPWQKGCGAAHAVAPHHASQEVNELHGLGEAVGSALTPTTSLSCPYNEGWAHCWPGIRCRGEVAGGEKCQHTASQLALETVCACVRLHSDQSLPELFRCALKALNMQKVKAAWLYLLENRHSL